MIWTKGKSAPINSYHRGDDLQLLKTALWICACFWLLVSSQQIASAQTAAEEEHLIKAAFIYNFAKFTRWPESSWAKQSGPLHLCTVGEDKLVDELRRLGGQTIHAHPVITRSLAKAQNPEACHLLYIATSEQQHYKNILKTLHGKPVLTVSELRHFGRSGGMIELYRDQGKTHFIINLGTARAAGLELSARLLSLAVIINDETTP